MKITETKCYQCGGPGHVKADCWKNPDSWNHNRMKGKGKKGEGKKGKGKGKESHSWTPLVQKRRGRSADKSRDDAPVCKFNKTGQCSQGDKCTFWHADVCKHFLRGTCVLGGACVYVHSDGGNRGRTHTPRGGHIMPVVEDTQPQGPKPKAQVKAKAKAKVKHE